MTDFYIFRHGDTMETKSSGIFAKFIRQKGGGSPSLPILPKGVPALEKIGKFLKDIPIDAGFTSPYLRCAESAKIVEAVSNKKYVLDERIRELQGGRKNFSDFRERIIEFLDEIGEKNYSAVSICTHGAVVAAIKHLKTDGKFFFFQVWDFPAPGKLIIIKNKKVNTIDFN